MTPPPFPDDSQLYCHVKVKITNISRSFLVCRADQCLWGNPIRLVCMNSFGLPAQHAQSMLRKILFSTTVLQLTLKQTWSLIWRFWGTQEMTMLCEMGRRTSLTTWMSAVHLLTREVSSYVCCGSMLSLGWKLFQYYCSCWCQNSLEQSYR